MSETELWRLVNNANSHSDIRETERIINESDIDNDIYDDLMNALSFISRELYSSR